MRDNDEAKPGTFNANSVIMTVSSVIILGVLSWIGNKTTENATAMTQMQATMPFVNQSIIDLRAQVSNLVSRAELDSRISELKAQQSVLEKRIILLEVGGRGKEPQ